jgi:hypothetical protein
MSYSPSVSTQNVPVRSPHNNKSRIKYDFTEEQLRPYFHLPLAVAARKLFTCTATLKRVCRRIGIAAWPHRHLKSEIKKLRKLNKVKSQAPGAQSDSEVDFKMQRMTQIASLLLTPERITEATQKMKTKNKCSNFSMSRLLTPPLADEDEAVSSKRMSPKTTSSKMHPIYRGHKAKSAPKAQKKLDFQPRSLVGAPAATATALPKLPALSEVLARSNVFFKPFPSANESKSCRLMRQCSCSSCARSQQSKELRWRSIYPQQQPEQRPPLYPQGYQTQQHYHPQQQFNHFPRARPALMMTAVLHASGSSCWV